MKLDDTNSTLMSLSSVDSTWMRLCTPGVCVCVGGGGGGGGGVEVEGRR